MVVCNPLSKEIPKTNVVTVNIEKGFGLENDGKGYDCDSQDGPGSRYDGKGSNRDSRDDSGINANALVSVDLDTLVKETPLDLQLSTNPFSVELESHSGFQSIVYPNHHCTKYKAEMDSCGDIDIVGEERKAKGKAWKQ